MINKLRLKFIWITMVAMIACTASLVTAINVVNYIQTNREINSLLGVISENDGQFPNHDKSESDEESNFHKRYSEESEYENRFFSVKIFADNSETDVDIRHVVTVTEENAIDLTQEAIGTGKQYGYIGSYKFYVRTSEEYIFVTFLDCETKLSDIESLGWTSVIIAMIGIALVFVFVLLMSKRAIQPLVESTEKQKRFITDASHELKTPLTVISTNMELLSMDIGENEWVKGTQKQVSNLRKLVNNLVSLSRMEEENVPLLMQKFNVSDAVEDTVAPFIAVAEFEGKTFHAEIQPNLFIDGDEGAIRQLVSILCDNAVKYASGEGNIFVSLKKSGKKVILEVSNFWEASIDSKKLNHFFDRFYRADESRSKENGKTSYGIGLSIAKAIVEKHHGKISVKQNEQKQIVFTASFL